MSLDDQLAELLANLGVVLEDASSPSGTTPFTGPHSDAATERTRFHFGGRGGAGEAERSAAMEDGIPLDAPSEVSLFQTSREHYGVFYRLDLAQGVPHLRVYLPDDDGCLKMRCYLVRAALGTPLHEWFVSARAHSGSGAYDEIRNSAEQHLLFAAGELMKRLFWTGSTQEMSFPVEVEVMRLL